MSMTIGILASSKLVEEVTTKKLFPLFTLGGHEVWFTSHMLMIALASILLMILLPAVLYRPKLVPSGLGNAIETICVFIREDVARPFLKEETDTYIGVLWTLFFFILTMNLLGLMPIAQMVFMFTGKHNIGGAPTANIWVTGALATFSFFLFHAAGIQRKGFWHYLATLSPKVPWPMLPFMFVLELISSFVRLFSLAIRLFANILAGHILLGTILGFIVLFKNFMVATGSLVGTVLMSLLEIFVAFLQAYIFVFLTAIFISFAVDDEH